jgi:transposase, IS5 family
MRVVQNPQMQIGEVDISQIQFNLKSGDEIPKILRGLQHVRPSPSCRHSTSVRRTERSEP